MIHPQTKRVLDQAIDLTKHMTEFLELLLRTVNDVESEQPIKKPVGRPPNPNKPKRPGRMEAREFRVGQTKFYSDISTTDCNNVVKQMKHEGLLFTARRLTIDGVTGALLARLR